MELQAVLLVLRNSGLGFPTNTTYVEMLKWQTKYVGFFSG
jgi:hypothetical protein